MFTQNPIDSEFFDTDTFIEENESLLYQLTQDAKAAMNGQGVEYDEIDIAVIMSTAICNGEHRIKSLPVQTLEEHEDAICDLAPALCTLVAMFSLEDKGCIQKNSEGDYFLTDKGKLAAGELETQKDKD